MQQFACVEAVEASTVYMPLHGFTAVDLGYQQGNAVSNFVNRMDEPVGPAVSSPCSIKFGRMPRSSRTSRISFGTILHRFTRKIPHSEFTF